MRETTEVDEKSKPWRWPGEWIRDEKFWKDVASRTLSGVLAVGVIYVYGLAVGYFQTPIIVGTTLAATGMIGFVIVLVTMFVVVFRIGIKKITGHETFLRKFELFLAISGAILIIGTILLGFSGAFDGVALEDVLLFS